MTAREVVGTVAGDFFMLIFLLGILRSFTASNSTRVLWLTIMDLNKVPRFN